MKTKFRKRFTVMCVMLIVVLLGSTNSYAAKNDYYWNLYKNDPYVADYNVMARARRVPGGPSYYDSLTGMEFLPGSGEILNLSSATRIPGEPLYQRQGYKAFYPPMYSQYIPEKATVNLSDKNTGDGYTVYIGLALEGGFVGSGGASGNLVVSYNKDTQKWHLGILGSTNGNVTIGSKFDAEFHVGFSNGNTTTLSGFAYASSAEVPLLEGTISVNPGTLHTTVEFAFQAGASANYSQGITYSWYKDIVVFGNPFR